MAKKTKTEEVIRGIHLGKKNIYLFLSGIALLIIGYILMAQPPVNGFMSRTLAPIVLVVAYLVIIPISILAKNKE